MILVHATSVEIAGQGVLIRGPSGSGKSDLAIRLIDGGAQLISDDQTELSRQGERVVARAPETIAGLLEARGLGIIRVAHRPWAPVSLVVDLVEPEQVERLPEPGFADFLGLRIPRVDLAPFQASAAAKLRLAVHSAKRDIMPS